MAVDPKEPVVYSPFSMWLRKLGIGLNVSIGLALAVVLWLLINTLASRYPLRWDMSHGQYFSLSEKTLRILDGLQEPMQVYAFASPEHGRYNELERLLREYSLHSRGRLTVRFIDRAKDMATADNLIRDYKLTANTTREAFLLVTRGDQRQVLPLREMWLYDEADASGTRRRAFVGEQWLTTTLVGLTRESRPVVYVMQGQGMREIANYDPVDGLSEFEQLLRRENLEVRPWRDASGSAVPGDADAVVIPGPLEPLSEEHLDQLRAYLSREGRLWVLVDSLVDTGLGPLMEEWGLELRNQVVVDPRKTFSGEEIFVAQGQYNEQHPVTASLDSVSVVLYLPRPVELSDNAARLEDARHDVLMETSAFGEARRGSAGAVRRPFNPATDKRGVVPLAVAVERGGLSTDTQVAVRPARLVVVGDADFITNARLRAGAIDFSLNAVNWLVNRDELLEISPKPVDRVWLIMSNEQMRVLFGICVGVIPGVGALLGVITWIRRRR